MSTARNLIFMRHAKAEAGHDALDDHDRSLTERGISDAESAGRWFAEHDLIPEVILCSSANRTQQTAATVAACWDRQVPIQSDQRLYLASPETVLKCIRQEAADEGCILVVGHNPGLEMLAGHYSGAGGHFQTAAAIVLQFELSDWDHLALNSQPTVIANHHP